MRASAASCKCYDLNQYPTKSFKANQILKGFQWQSMGTPPKFGHLYNTSIVLGTKQMPINEAGQRTKLEGWFRH